MGECFVGRVNIGLEQIRSGNAIAWPSYLRQNAQKAPAYTAAEAEAEARREGRGLFGPAPVIPPSSYQPVVPDGVPGDVTTAPLVEPAGEPFRR